MSMRAGVCSLTDGGARYVGRESLRFVRGVPFRQATVQMKQAVAARALVQSASRLQVIQQSPGSRCALGRVPPKKTDDDEDGHDSDDWRSILSKWTKPKPQSSQLHTRVRQLKRRVRLLPTGGRRAWVVSRAANERRGIATTRCTPCPSKSCP